MFEVIRNSLEVSCLFLWHSNIHLLNNSLGEYRNVEKHYVAKTFRLE